MDEKEFITSLNELKKKLDSFEKREVGVIYHILFKLFNNNLIIEMHKESNHELPHFHLSYKKEFELSISIDPVEVIAGRKPTKKSENKKIKAAIYWAEENKSYLLEQWNRLKEGMEPITYQAHGV